MLKYIIPCLFIFISGSLYAQKEHLPSREAHRYFNEAFTYIEDTYYFTHKIKWNKLKKEVLPLLADAKTKQDAYPAIEYVVNHLYDKHSWFCPPPGASSGKRSDTIYHFNASIPPGFPVCYITPEGIGYLFIPSNFYLPYDEKELQQWTDSLLYPIFRFDEKGVNGWIIDLRFNTGGYMNAMLNGIAPLIGRLQYYQRRDQS
jgi:carboxyl-terminal processing protease